MKEFVSLTVFMFWFTFSFIMGKYMVQMRLDEKRKQREKQSKEKGGNL